MDFGNEGWFAANTSVTWLGLDEPLALLQAMVIRCSGTMALPVGRGSLNVVAENCREQLISPVPTDSIAR